MSRRTERGLPPSDGITAHLRRLFTFRQKVHAAGAQHRRGPVTHVIVIDGTMSSLERGVETNAGLTYRLCSEAAEGPQGANMIVRYEAGIQWRTWRDARAVIEGRGINQQIKRLYGALASRYRDGDRIYLFGYSRGAYAVRSLSGLIDTVGLLAPEHATEHNITTAFRHYQSDPTRPSAREFRHAYCRSHTPIAFLGVWDTVSAVGLHFPILWRFSSVFHVFHDQYPARNVAAVYHALARHERRRAYAPVMFKTNPDAPNQRLVQMWFRGSHGDVGGQVGTDEQARKLSNDTLVWMLDKAESYGLELPQDWRARFLRDPQARSAGMNRGWGKLFWFRRERTVGADPSEYVHPAAR